MDSLYTVGDTATIKIDDSSWTGVVVNVGEDSGQSTLTITGGRGVSKTIPPRFFRGLSVSSVVGDACTSAGVKFECSVTGTVDLWVRTEGLASTELDRLASKFGAEWSATPANGIKFWVPSWTAIAPVPQFKSMDSTERRREYYTPTMTLFPGYTVDGYQIDSAVFVSTHAQTTTRIYYR